MLYGLYTSSKLPMGHVIRHASWSFYSHCAITDCVDVWESRALQGVVKTSYNQWIVEHTDELVDFDDRPAKLPLYVRDEAEVINWMDSKLGCGYDYAELVGHIIHLNLGSRERFTCSSFFIEAINRHGCYLEHDEYFRMAPRNVRQSHVSFNNGYEFRKHGQE